MLHQEYDKHFILESRIKSVDKIKLKYKLQIKKGLSGNANGLVPDIIGFRISVDSEDEVDKIKKFFAKTGLVILHTHFYYLIILETLNQVVLEPLQFNIVYLSFLMRFLLKFK